MSLHIGKATAGTAHGSDQEGFGSIFLVLSQLCLQWAHGGSVWKVLYLHSFPEYSPDRGWDTWCSFCTPSRAWQMHAVQSSRHQSCSWGA